MIDSTHPQYLAQNITSAAWGAEQTLENGCAGSGCTDAVEIYVYNNRLQPVMIELGTQLTVAFGAGQMYTPGQRRSPK